MILFILVIIYNWYIFEIIVNSGFKLHQASCSTRLASPTDLISVLLCSENFALAPPLLPYSILVLALLWKIGHRFCSPTGSYRLSLVFFCSSEPNLHHPPSSPFSSRHYQVMSFLLLTKLPKVFLVIKIKDWILLTVTFRLWFRKLCCSVIDEFSVSLCFPPSRRKGPFDHCPSSCSNLIFELLIFSFLLLLFHIPPLFCEDWRLEKTDWWFEWVFFWGNFDWLNFSKNCSFRARSLWLSLGLLDQCLTTWSFLTDSFFRNLACVSSVFSVNSSSTFLLSISLCSLFRLAEFDDFAGNILLSTFIRPVEGGVLALYRKYTILLALTCT